VSTLTLSEVRQALGEPLCLPAAPGTITWHCPLCPPGLALIVTGDAGMTCDGAGHTSAQIEAAVRVVLAAEEAAWGIV
jgi:hypothetical protein